MGFKGGVIINNIKYFSLFSGIGGFECGIQESKLNAECVGYSEVDKYADTIYKRNFPNHKRYGDATEIDTRKLPNFDFLIGGFPCQPFSICGKRQGFEDTRGTLFFEIARILKDKRPKYFLFENVKGLLSHNNGETFKTILEVFNEKGYDVLWEIHNSKEFLPQERERVFLKGYFRRKCRREILYQATDCNKTVEMKNKNNDGWYHLSDDVKVTVSKDDCAYCLVAQPPQREFSKKSNTYVVYDYDRIRKLTPVECERLQGFKDNYTKYGANGEVISDSQRYKCLGNAVTVPVVSDIVNRMFRL